MKIMVIAACVMLATSVAQAQWIKEQRGEGDTAIVKVVSAKETGKFLFDVKANGNTIPYINAVNANKDGETRVDISYISKYEFSGGILKETGGQAKTLSGYSGKRTNCEADRFSMSFGAADLADANIKKDNGFIKKKGRKQVLSYRGEVFATYESCKLLTCSADSSALAAAGWADGKKWMMHTSKGQSVQLPARPERLLMSPNGGFAAAMIVLDKKLCFFLSDGRNITLEGSRVKDAWLHDSGNLFSVDADNDHALNVNGRPFHEFSAPVKPSNIFISRSGNRMAWEDEKGRLNFSDGTRYLSVTSAFRETVGARETVFFIVTENGKAWLCQKEL